MCQEIGPVTLSHSMSLVVTLTQDWRTCLNFFVNDKQFPGYLVIRL